MKLVVLLQVKVVLHWCLAEFYYAIEDINSWQCKIPFKCKDPTKYRYMSKLSRPIWTTLLFIWTVFCFSLVVVMLFFFFLCLIYHGIRPLFFDWIQFLINLFVSNCINDHVMSIKWILYIDRLIKPSEAFQPISSQGHVALTLK